MPISKNSSRHSLQAFGLAVLIETAIVAGAAVILIGSAPAKQTISDPVPITLVADEPEKPAEPKPLPPPPVPQPKVKAVVKPTLPKPQTPPPVQETPPVAQDPSPVAAMPTAFTEPSPAPVPPPPAVSGKVDPHAAYAAKVTAAVYISHHRNYPAAATAMRFTGKAQVEFHLRDGIISGSHILVSCGNGIFDQAALQAVQNALYPEAPADLRGHNNLYQVWVEFLR